MYYESIPLDIAIRAFNGGARPPAATSWAPATHNDVKNNPTFNPLVDCPNVYGAPIGPGPGPNTATSPATAAVASTPSSAGLRPLGS